LPAGPHCRDQLLVGEKREQLNATQNLNGLSRLVSDCNRVSRDLLTKQALEVVAGDFVDDDAGVELFNRTMLSISDHSVSDISAKIKYCKQNAGVGGFGAGSAMMKAVGVVMAAAAPNQITVKALSTAGLCSIIGDAFLARAGVKPPSAIFAAAAAAAAAADGVGRGAGAGAAGAGAAAAFPAADAAAAAAAPAAIAAGAAGAGAVLAAAKPARSKGSAAAEPPRNKPGVGGVQPGDARKVALDAQKQKAAEERGRLEEAARQTALHRGATLALAQQSATLAAAQEQREATAAENAEAAAKVPVLQKLSEFLGRAAGSSDDEKMGAWNIGTSPLVTAADISLALAGAALPFGPPMTVAKVSAELATKAGQREAAIAAERRRMDEQAAAAQQLQPPGAKLPAPVGRLA
jgi:hypothetical protein